MEYICFDISGTPLKLRDYVTILTGRNRGNEGFIKAYQEGVCYVETDEYVVAIPPQQIRFKERPAGMLYG